MVAAGDLHGAWAGATVGDLMRGTAPLAPGQDLEAAATSLAEAGLDAAAVVEGGAVVGLLRFDDLIARLGLATPEAAPRP